MDIVKVTCSLFFKKMKKIQLLLYKPKPKPNYIFKKKHIQKNTIL